MEKITSRRNPLCIHIRKLGESRNYREECGEYLCDGLKLFEEAVNSGVRIKTVVAASPVPFPLETDTRVYYTDRSLLESLSPLKNARDMIFTCKIPKPGVLPDAESTHILLDRVQDPGNVGTIIRTASAFGIKSVILTDGCADHYNPKSIRASMGAIFRQSVCIMNIKELVGLVERGVRFIGSVPGKGSTSVAEVNCGKAIIAIGSEGQGLSEKVRALCHEIITIPIAPECESLNAASAAAIIMWEASKKAGTRD